MEARARFETVHGVHIPKQAENPYRVACSNISVNAWIMHAYVHVCTCARARVASFFSRRVETVYRLQHIPQEHWSLLCSQPQPLLYTRNPALWENKGRRQAATEGSVISKAVREDARARGSSGHFGFLRGRP